jgi:hypothetical protein
MKEGNFTSTWAAVLFNIWLDIVLSRSLEALFIYCSLRLGFVY